MINNYVATGRLTKDIDLRYSQSGTAIASFNLAVQRSFKTQDGQEADFIQCVAFKKTAEVMANHLRKGSLIGIEGRMQTRNYDNNQGQRVYVTEAVVEKVTFLESKKDASNNNQGYGQANAQGGYQGQPNAQNSINNDPFANNGAPIDISDDDLPF